MVPHMLFFLSKEFVKRVACSFPGATSSLISLVVFAVSGTPSHPLKDAYSNVVALPTTMLFGVSGLIGLVHHPVYLPLRYAFLTYSLGFMGFVSFFMFNDYVTPTGKKNETNLS